LAAPGKGGRRVVSGRSMAFAAAAVAAAGAALLGYRVLGTKDTVSLKPDDARVAAAGVKDLSGELRRLHRCAARGANQLA
jgi:hypothetical protein